MLPGALASINRYDPPPKPAFMENDVRNRPIIKPYPATAAQICIAAIVLLCVGVTVAKAEEPPKPDEVRACELKANACDVPFK